ncbi:MAG: SGNH/GDSL hydrolase family protein [Ignavibacteriales bacterium]
MAAQILSDLVARLLDANGNPVSGGSVTFYLTGTTTKQTVYANSALTVALTNPLSTNSAGLFVNASNQPTAIYLDPQYVYRAVYNDATGTTIRDVDPVNPDTLNAQVAAAEAAQTAAEAAQAASEAARDDAQDILDSVTTAGDTQSQRLTDEATNHIVEIASAASSQYYAASADGVSNGVASISGLVAGSGGTNGQFDLAFSGGGGSGAAGRFVVSGGAVTTVTLTAAGHGYTSAPTISFAASAGLTGASASAVIAGNTNDGEYYLVQGADADTAFELWQNVSGSATYRRDFPSKSYLDNQVITGSDSALCGYEWAVIDSQYRIIEGQQINGPYVIWAPMRIVNLSVDDFSSGTITTNEIITPLDTIGGTSDPELSGYLEAQVDKNYRVIAGRTAALREVHPRSFYWPSSDDSASWRVTCTDGNVRKISGATGAVTALTSANADRYPRVLPDESGVIFQRDQGMGVWADYYVPIGGGTAQPVDSLPQIAGWGDSMTQNVGYTPWLDRLTTALNRITFNGGIAGETSTQIKNRMVVDTIHNNWLTIIEAGRNDILTSGQATVTANIAAMVAHLQAVNKRYLVVSIFNTSGEPSGSAAYNTITACNAALAATYGSSYLDVRGWMIANGLAAAGLTATTQDNTDIANDVVPTSLRITSDTLHHNDYGTTAFAACVQNAIQTRGW